MSFDKRWAPELVAEHEENQLLNPPSAVSPGTSNGNAAHMNSGVVDANAACPFIKS